MNNIHTWNGFKLLVDATVKDNGATGDEPLHSIVVELPLYQIGDDPMRALCFGFDSGTAGVTIMSSSRLAEDIIDVTICREFRDDEWDKVYHILGTDEVLLLDYRDYLNNTLSQRFTIARVEVESEEGSREKTLFLYEDGTWKVEEVSSL
jgi:hypothetical protein